MRIKIIWQMNFIATASVAMNLRLLNDLKNLTPRHADYPLLQTSMKQCTNLKIWRSYLQYKRSTAISHWLKIQSTLQTCMQFCTDPTSKFRLKNQWNASPRFISDHVSAFLAPPKSQLCLVFHPFCGGLYVFSGWGPDPTGCTEIQETTFLIASSQTCNYGGGNKNVAAWISYKACTWVLEWGGRIILKWSLENTGWNEVIQYELFYFGCV